MQEETTADPCLQTLKTLIQSVWPESMQDLPNEVKPYWCFKDELGIIDCLIMKGIRVIIPSSMRSESLTRLHDGHQGTSSTLQRARRTMYWPNIQNYITEMIQRCEECQIHGNQKAHPPSRQISATKPMEIIATDIMSFGKQPVLVTIDYFSGYIMVDPLKSETFSEVAAHINDNVRKFGLAERILSDNGSCFRSEMSQNFYESLEIYHSKSSPYYHQSNCRVRCAIQTARNIFKDPNLISKSQKHCLLIMIHQSQVSYPLQQNCF